MKPGIHRKNAEKMLSGMPKGSIFSRYLLIAGAFLLLVLLVIVFGLQTPPTANAPYDELPEP